MSRHDVLSCLGENRSNSGADGENISSGIGKEKAENFEKFQS